MYKKIRFSAAAFLVVAVFILPDCTKLIDYLESHPGADPLCRIERMISNGDTMTFTYNHDGNPVSALRKTTLNGDDWLFFYDSHDRMSEAFVTFGDYTFSNGKVSGRGDWFHKYTYDKWNRIVTDTAFAGPVVTNGQLTQFHGGSSFSNFVYDSKSRLIQETITTLYQEGPGPVEGIAYYNYNSNGNFVRDGYNWVYDNKINLNRTNKIWMLINRDYSVNNPFTATSYSSFGLPLYIPAAPRRFLDFVPGLTQVDYSCH